MRGSHRVVETSVGAPAYPICEFGLEATQVLIADRRTFRQRLHINNKANELLSSSKSEGEFRNQPPSRPASGNLHREALFVLLIANGRGRLRSTRSWGCSCRSTIRFSTQSSGKPQFSDTNVVPPPSKQGNPNHEQPSNVFPSGVRHGRRQTLRPAIRLGLRSIFPMGETGKAAQGKRLHLDCTDRYGALVLHAHLERGRVVGTFRSV